MNGGRSLILAATTAVLILAVLVLPAPPADAVSTTCNESGGRYTAGSAYQANLAQVANSLPTNASTSQDLFATAIAGAGTTNTNNQTVYAIGLCRGDLVPDTCLVCLRAGFSGAQLACPLYADVTANYDAYHMRFSSLNFLNSTNNTVQLPYISSFPTVAASAAGRFNGLVAELLDATAAYAADTSGRRFATGEMDVDDAQSRPGAVFQHLRHGAVHAGPDSRTVQGMPGRGHGGDAPTGVPSQFDGSELCGRALRPAVCPLCVL